MQLSAAFRQINLLVLTIRLCYIPNVAPFVSPHDVPSVARIGRQINRNRTRSPAQLNNNKNKNFVDEILDALDTMAGVSPLSETDLKENKNNWVERAQQRDAQRPPADALQKPSVAIFFLLLGGIPSVLFLYAVQSGAVKPFNL